MYCHAAVKEMPWKGAEKEPSRKDLRLHASRCVP
jgi:hypothetical protein